MDQQQHAPQTADGPELGRAFEAQSSSSYGGDLGSSFVEHNSSPKPARHPGRRRLIWIVVVALVLIILAAVFFTSKPKKGANKAGGGRGAEAGAPAITAGKSTTGNINIYDDALGTVTPVYTVTIYSQVTGKVIAVHYHEGQYVHRGDPLIDIDPRPYEATLRQAEGQLDHDRGVLAEARIDLARYQAAYARNAIARQLLEDQEQAVVQDEGTVKADEGSVAYDRVQLAFCHIVSPINGRVGLRLVDPGNTVFAGTGATLVVVTQVQPITVVFNVSEDDLPQIQAQLKAQHSLEADAYDRSSEKEIAAGRLAAIDNQIDTTTGTLKFRANFANPDLKLFPNQFVNVHLLVKTLVNATLLPSAAVQHNGTEAFVYIVKPGAKGGDVVATQGIQVLTSNEKVTAVTGINPGMTVATSGFDRLESGVPVKVRAGNAGPQQQAATPSSGSGNGSPGGGNTAP